MSEANDMTRTATRLASPAPSVDATRLIRALAAMTFLQWLAASLVLPLLPVYLQQRGGSDLLIGLAMGGFFVGALAAQYPLGRLSDRIAPRTLLLATVAGYAFATLGFLLPLDPTAMVGVRAVQGAMAGATEVLALAMIGRTVPARRRPQGYAAIFAMQMAGLAVGPLLAGAVGGTQLTLLFTLAAGAASAALLPLLGCRNDRSARLERREHVPLPIMRQLRPVLIAAVITGLTTGVYEACWTLLLVHRDATAWQIGLSWSLFCVPFVVVSAFAGPLIDRLGASRLRSLALCCSVVLVLTYPFVTSIPVVLALGAVEGVATAVAYPATQTFIAGEVPAGELGRVQGGFATAQTAAIAVSAAGGGALFAVASWVPFVVVGLVCAVLLATLRRLRRTSAGR